MLARLGTDTPIPTPSMTVDPNAVTPGPLGFAFMVVIVLAVVLLIWDMNRRIRRVRYREEVREELDAEERAAAQRSPDAPEHDGPSASDAAPADDATPDAGTDPAGEEPTAR